MLKLVVREDREGCLVANCIARKIDNFVGDRQTGCRRWARCVEHMKCTGLACKVEVLDEFPARRKSLRPHSGAALHQVVDLEFWDEPLQ